MASTTAAVDDAPPPSAPVDEITTIKDEVYNTCLAIAEDDGMKTVFYQSTIFSFDIIPNNDVQILLQVTQRLLNEKLFNAVKDAERLRLGWRVRTEEDAMKYRTLTVEQEIVYSKIDEAGSDGIWTKTMKSVTGMNDTVMRTSIKQLEARNMITDMKSVEHPTRKMYILSSLRPSERASGGAWYTDGELDMEFIDQLMMVMYTQIKKRSVYTDTAALRKPAKTLCRTMTPAQARAARETGLGPRRGGGAGESVKTAKRRLYEATLPMPPSFSDYIGVHELTGFIESSGINTGSTLGAHEVQQLLDIMCYDARIERVVGTGEGVGYRILRKSLKDPDDVTSALTEVPCGRCPVFDLCEEGGPVSPSNCEYFTDWLDI